VLTSCAANGELSVTAAEAPTLEDFAVPSQAGNLLPIPWVEAVDISNAVDWLASDEARYVTGVALPVDAGAGAI
jgi:(+)-trans-carveol dehydrogenase